MQWNPRQYLPIGCSLLLLGAALPSLAADDLWMPARLSVGYDVFPNAGLSNPQPGTFEPNVKWHESTVSAGVAFSELSPGHQWLLTHGFSYKHYGFGFDNWDPSMEAPPPDSLHAIRYHVSILRFLENHQSVAVFLSPGLNSDLHNVQWDHANLMGGAMGNLPVGRSTFGLGLAYTMTFGKPRLLPILSWRWSDQEHWRVAIVAPAAANAWYRFNERFEAGLGLGFSGGQFRIGEAGAYQDKVVRYSTGKFGPAINLKLAESLSLRVQGGLAFRRRYGIFDGNDEIKNLDTGNSGFIQALLSYKVGPGGSNEQPAGSDIFQ